VRSKPNEVRAKAVVRGRKAAKPSLAETQRRIQEGLEDLRQGRVDGPYPDAETFVRALQADIREQPERPKR
jgi:hypothetical protein